MKKYRVRMVGTNGHNVYFLEKRHRFLFWTWWKDIHDSENIPQDMIQEVCDLLNGDDSIEGLYFINKTK